jgi:hypothetical protein
MRIIIFTAIITLWFNAMPGFAQSKHNERRTAIEHPHAVSDYLPQPIFPREKKRIREGFSHPLLVWNMNMNSIIPGPSV